MSKKQILVVLATCLATNRGSFGVGDNYPCETKEEAQRMVDAGQAKHPNTENVSAEDFNALQLINEGLTNELAAANKKLKVPGELPEEVKKKITDLELQVTAANEKLAEPVTLPDEIEQKISELTKALATANDEKADVEKSLQTASKELISANKKLAAAETKLKKQVK